ncbi:hypothetical protein [Streptomyces sp. BPTC-684]|uniref:hypothetical protein n=1 Tax=Streptomyces sp. BPTC-684 TaxID=3043734 RepID=UPI0024B1362D|nr:hypothetical protein [Streptomyces sp. BPTC-684]WHM36327.1 hypothetical protein QIY60_04855 [Streptomyces sp. BPTC-684]
MIHPKVVHVARFDPEENPGSVWLAFDAAAMVELTPEQARALTYELGAQIGLSVSAHTAVTE